ncbi:hypothetical protein LUZ63_006662 [Rhynchospora breviuscula]|uniref:Uncharacterized protein n=1 Tax=Rhynchospora breviuscula TaxID=2022672 RepID=A0A9Q0CQT2_9POAL|nr:hypothetical protein LUZ63_006662 [Rhynchospora breviuscula]
MGNCLTQGSKTWAVDDEWDYLESTSQEVPQPKKKEVSPSVDAGSTIVKIKLTKKQLEEILGKAGLGTDQNLPIELLIKHAVNKRCEESVHDRNRHWRPVLQTIPEAAE